MMFIGLLRREQLHCGAVVVQSRVAGIGPQIGYVVPITAPAAA
jgi:hypothetical protein